MAAPNIVNVTSIIGKTDVQSVTTTATAITTNNSSSGRVYKINSLIVANIDGTNAGTVTADLYRSTTSYKFANTINVPADSTVVLIAKDSPVYLEEGDAIRLLAAANSTLQAICSYEIIS